MTASAPPVPAAVAQSTTSFPLQVISLTGACWEGRVREASVPGAEGRLGIMAGHLPLLAPLREGLVRLFPEQGQTPVDIHVTGGYLEVQPDQVIVLADLASRSTALDAARADEARQRASSPMAAALTGDDYGAMHAGLVAHLAHLHRSSRPR